MRELSSHVVSMTYEIAATEEIDEVVPIRIFFTGQTMVQAGWLGGKYEELYRSGLTKAFLKNMQDNKSCEKMSAQPPKKKTHGAARKRRHR